MVLNKTIATLTALVLRQRRFQMDCPRPSNDPAKGRCMCLEQCALPAACAVGMIRTQFCAACSTLRSRQGAFVMNDTSTANDSAERV